MKQFFAHAWANPRTTFGIGVAVCTLLAADLADGQPFTLVKGIKILGGVLAIFGGAAASDAATAAKAST